ncbi:kinase-regulated stress-responsive transcription factor skn7 [Basidiobolus ranarum]|uniref:Kinase-regulated stress-responsive transcription factor skn7 n=1 Tax=Basidiobolus ranarum TaxID=34480 RepID=A0ABR2VQG8_9FUNG
MLEGYTDKLGATPFVLNLYKILSEQRYSDVITWEQSGTKFIIKDLVGFSFKVLPQYYDTNKLALFSRQLSVKRLIV